VGTVQTDPYSQAPLFIKMRFATTELAAGTAFFYRLHGELYLISNWHNFSGRNPETQEPLSDHGGLPNNILCYACLNLPHIKRAWLELPLESDGKPVWFQHPTQGGKVDIGVLPVVLPSNFRAVILNEFSSTPMTLRVSHDVFVLGYPLGLMAEHGLPVWKRASVATEPGTSSPSFFIDTASRSGMSGSPVLFRYRGFYKHDTASSAVSEEDWFGEGDMFIGVYSGRLGASSVEAQLGVVWKAHLIDEVITARVAYGA
jgi:hypothetical protein